RKSNLQAEFESIGPRAAEHLRGLARDRRGGLREQVRHILALCEEYSRDQVHEAMVRAESYNNHNWLAVKRILKKRDAHPRALPDAPRNRTEEEELPPALSIDVQTRHPSYYSEIAEEVARDL
ncbi:MAG: hypothetical protein ACOC39_02415, partial [Desulfovermiculus sp.]